MEEGSEASVLTALGSAGWKKGLGVVPVNGLSRLLGASCSGCRSLFPVGRIRRLGKPEGVNSSSSSLALSNWVGTRLSGRPELVDALGTSGKLGAVLESGSPVKGRLALFPVGTIRTPGLKRLSLPPVVPLPPVGATLLGASSSSSAAACWPLTGALIAAVGPGKSSGTIGRPRTRESREGGVVGGLGGAGGRAVDGGASACCCPRPLGGLLKKLV